MSQIAERTHQIIHDMLADLPALVGPDQWPTLAAELARLDVEWAAANATRRMGLGAQYRTLLAPHPAARVRLATALRDATLHDDGLLATATLVEQLGDVAGAAALREAAGRRYITGLKVGQAAHSLKLGNVAFNVPNVAMAAGSILTTIAALVAPDAQAIAGAGAVLLLIAGLSQSFVREINADDASVFLGLARATGSDRTAALADIVAATNAARNDGPLRLGVLTEHKVHEALSRLSVMKSVAPVGDKGDRWRAIEEHGAA